MTSGDQGVVLHTRPFREASQFVSLFIVNHGRFYAVSRATRTRGSGNQLRPFLLLRFCWRGRGDLQTLESVETVAVPTPLAGEKLFVGFYPNELLTRLVHEHDPYPALFDRYARALTILATTEEVEPMLRYFELKLLEDLGYGLCLDVDME